MKHRITYSIRPKNEEKKKTRMIENHSVPSFSLEEFKRYPEKETPLKPKNILKKLAVIGGGVAVGLLFGYALMQTLVNPSNLNETGKPTQPAMSTKVTTSGKEMSLTLQELNVFLVQAGVFSTEDSANKIVSEFKNKQQPVEVIQEEGKYVVYVGISSSRDEALSIAQFYRSQNTQVIIKEKQIPSGNVPLQASANVSQAAISELNQLSGKEAELIQLLTAHAGSGFDKGRNTGTFDQEKLTALQDYFVKQESVLTNLLNDPAKTSFTNSLNELKAGIQAAKNNQMLQIQENLLRFYSKEVSFRSGNDS